MSHKPRFPPIAILFVMLFAIAVTVAAVTPVGDDFQINPPGAFSSSAFLQAKRHVSAASDGSFVVVWYGSNGSADPYNIYNAVWGRRFDSAGMPLTDRFMVNSYTTGSQANPAVASTQSGSFLVVWQGSPDGTISGNEVKGRMFGADGLPATDEFQVNTHTDMFQGEPSIAAWDNGDFVVVWTSVVFGQAADIAGQRFDSDGDPIGTEFAVNSYTTLAQGTPQVSTTSNGFVATWGSLDIDDSAVGVVARRFDMTGAGIGDDFIVNTYTTFDQEEPDVSAADDGSFVVVWESGGQDGENEGVFGQRFDTNGMPAGTEFQVSVTTTDSQHEPSVYYDADGIVVVWSDEPRTPSLQDPVETTARCYDVDGNPLTGEVSLSEAIDCLDCRTSVTRGGTGELVAAWTGPPDGQFGFAVRARRLDLPASGACGDPVDPALLLARVGTEAVNASDALFVLQAAVGAAQCLECICNVDSEGGITATDALLVLQVGVGQTNIVLNCPPC